MIDWEALVPGAEARARARIAAWFCARHALYAEDAIEFRPLRAPAQRAFADLAARGIVKAASPGRFWLELGAFDADVALRRRRAVPVALGAVAVGVAAALLLYRG